jgi:hypothetical protein
LDNECIMKMGAHVNVLMLIKWLKENTNHEIGSYV